jgi:hypothetical protein
MTRVAVVACGALAIHVKAIASRNGWQIDVYPLPPELHSRPERIAPAVEAQLAELRGRYDRVVVGYADCGANGALDGHLRLPGDTCYDLFAGQAEIARLREEQPGTFFLTDFLVRSFDRVVIRTLGLDRYPELRDDYFRHYTRVVWLAQARTPVLEAAAGAAAARIGLPLEVLEVGESGLERAVAEALIG